MAPASNVNIIDTKDEGIVVKETLISISDEKLKTHCLVHTKKHKRI